MDRDSGDYAILGIQLELTGSGGGAGDFSYHLERDLAPRLRAALAP